MADIQPILTEQDFQLALERLWEIFDAEPGTPEGDEREALADLVEAYDDEHYPIPDPPPAIAVQGRMENLELTSDDLIPAIGSREVVDEVLAGRQDITPEMAQALYELLDIDVRDLLDQATVQAANA